MRRSPLLLAALASLVLTPGALAAGRTPGARADRAARVDLAPAADRARAAVTAPPPRLSVRLAGGLLDRGRRYAVKGQDLAVEGTVDTSAPGQAVVVDLLRGGRLVRRSTAPVTPSGGGGRFRAGVTAATPGSYAVEAHIDAADGTRIAAAPLERFRALAPRPRRGGGGLEVRLLQRGLRALAYAAPASGRFDGATARAVLAFRKVNGMRRTGVANRAVYGRIFRGRGGFAIKYPRAGRHVEFDVSRQVLVLASRGRVERLYHASSGKRSTPTVMGSFRFYRRQWGRNAKDMVHSTYFVGGYAIHGYRSVPPYPASHGCIRVPMASALSIARWIRLGQRIFVYR